MSSFINIFKSSKSHTENSIKLPILETSINDQSVLYTKGDNPLSLSEKEKLFPSLSHMYIYINFYYSVHYIIENPWSVSFLLPKRHMVGLVSRT